MIQPKIKPSKKKSLTSSVNTAANHLNLLPKLQNQNRRLPKHQKFHYGQLLGKETSKP